MSLQADLIYRDGDVSIQLPNWEAIRRPELPDMAVEEGLDPALECIGVYEFFIYWRDEHVGTIELHVIDQDPGKGIILYLLFEPGHRGRGIGTKALGLLKRFVVERMRLTRLVAATSSDNIASQRVLQKCGFIQVGALLEDPTRLIFQWNVPSSR